MGSSYKKQTLTVYTNSTATAEKFINYIMKDGKKNVARNIYRQMLAEIKKQGHMNPQVVVEGAIENAAPSVMVKSKRVGGAVYQVPLEVKQNKKLFFACKWMLDAARNKKGSMAMNLAEEIMAAYAEQGNAVKKKEEAHKMAEANKAYAYMAKYVK
ncbi:MAG: 30S ribosomal protein S7 [Candidatus Peribacteria bacterium]|nr:MAG: 30S ribosomal protein S7 [Candidatus Peribacteria bacterium]